MFKSFLFCKQLQTVNYRNLLISTLILCSTASTIFFRNSSVAASSQSKSKTSQITAFVLLNTISLGRPINNSSGAAEIALAKHLTKKGVKMYGAHWCGACAQQKERFGKQAFAKIKYIECGTNGPDLRLCQQAGIRAYPTWKFPNGNTMVAVATLASLADASGYQGDRNFKN
jgi:hypothetical protein